MYTSAFMTRLYWNSEASLETGLEGLWGMTASFCSRSNRRTQHRLEANQSAGSAVAGPTIGYDFSVPLSRGHIAVKVRIIIRLRRKVSVAVPSLDLYGRQRGQTRVERRVVIAIS